MTTMKWRIEGGSARCRLRAMAGLLQTGMLLALLFCLAACHRDGASAAAAANDSAGAAISASDALLNDMEGVWVTSDHAGTDDAETVYIIQRQGQGLRLFVNEEEWKVTIDDIDDTAGTVALVHEANGPKEILTLRKVPATPAEGEGHHLSVTFGLGQTEQLGFVRRISPADLAHMREIEADAQRAAASTDDDDEDDDESDEGGVDCDPPDGFRNQQLCTDNALLEQHETLVARFETLIQAETADIGSTEAAAWKQLDACTSRRCLIDGYAHWLDYLEKNYPEPVVE